MKSHPAESVPAIVSIGAVITANQEQVEWWLRCGASLVALIAGALAIYRFFAPRRNMPENTDGLD